MTEALVVKLGPKGVQVQAVLPGITPTPIWTKQQMAGLPPGIVMNVGDMVDAAVKGLEMGETITIPALPDNADLDAYLDARRPLGPNLSRRLPADNCAA